MTSGSSSMIRSVRKKRLMIAIVEKNMGPKTSSSKMTPYNKRENNLFPIFPPFLMERETLSPFGAMDLGHRYSLVESKSLPSVVDQKDLRYCPHQRKKGHMLEQCLTFGNIFNEKHKVGDFVSKRSC